MIHPTRIRTLLLSALLLFSLTIGNFAGGATVDVPTHVDAESYVYVADVTEEKTVIFNNESTTALVATSPTVVVFGGEDLMIEEIYYYPQGSVDGNTVLTGPVEKTVDFSKPMDDGFYIPGNVAEITETGIYYVLAGPEAVAPKGFVLIVKERPPVDAVKTASTVLVNGKKVAFQAYNIGGNNYFRLRDLALALNGTDEQFSIDYNGETGVVTLTPGEAYVPIGGEMTGGGPDKAKGIHSLSTFMLDDEEISFNAYNINDTNYVKLRNVGAAFNFGTDWDAAAGTIVIDTSIGYTPE